MWGGFYHNMIQSSRLKKTVIKATLNIDEQEGVKHS
jgi:hypothetical protein